MQAPLFSLFTTGGVRKYTDIPEYRRFMEAVLVLPLKARTYCQIVALTGCRASEALALCFIHLIDNQLVFSILKRRRTVFRLVPIPEWLSSQIRELAAALSDRPSASFLKGGQRRIAGAGVGFNTPRFGALWRHRRAFGTGSGAGAL